MEDHIPNYTLRDYTKEQRNKKIINLIKDIIFTIICLICAFFGLIGLFSLG